MFKLTTVREYFQIGTEVEFEDVHIDSDNRIYLDLHAVRLNQGPEPFRSQALESADTFLGELAAAVLSGDPVRVNRSSELLCNFREPWQTRMGMSHEGFRGHGGAQWTGGAVLDAMTTNAEALVRVGVLKHLEQLPLFVDGVGNDICSDLTARVIMDALLDFTECQMHIHSGLRIETEMTDIRTWDANFQRWKSRRLQLPAPGGHPLVLVPSGWARANPLMTARRFHGVAVLGHVQESEARIDPKTGRLMTISKEVLKKRSDLADIRDANIRVTLEALSHNKFLLKSFEAYLAEWFRMQDNVAA